MELLSPAGNTKHVEVALKSKPGAVYGGLKNWNARHKALNFSVEDYNESVRKLHKSNIKFYLTLNTLLLDEEIKEIIKFLKDKATTLPDAFIVTDIGLIKKLRKEFPKVPLHFSTQFGAHNKEDLKLLEYLGAERAILARELTLPEINQLKAGSKLELECFVWGSQCMSYSGLCFFGSLINGGGGNRGKCITTCRDVYKVGFKEGNLLYVPDLDCINMIPELKGVDCIKLEGRRRDPKELEAVINQINNKVSSKNSNGYLYGKTVSENNLFEIINTRTKPLFKPNELKGITNDDVFIQYKNGEPASFTKEVKKDDVFYVYSEFKGDYDVHKKNLSFELTIDNSRVMEILYVNYKGEGKTFYDDKSVSSVSFSAQSFAKQLSSLDSIINVYKIRYKRNKEGKYTISSEVYDEILDYIKKDCKSVADRETASKFKPIKLLYVETNSEKVADSLIKDKFVKIIFNLDSFAKLKKVARFVKKYGNKIVYKLPLFNWESEDSLGYLKLLKGKDVMFTRLAQVFISKDIKFRNKYADYTIYVWNKYASDFLKKYGITRFTASPELSYSQNVSILNGFEIQFIIGGKLPLIYTRQCFSHLFGCSGCPTSTKKSIKNSDKGMDFEIICSEDNRYLIYDNPILNDYTALPGYKKATFRYVTYGQTLAEIKKSLKLFRSDNYYDAMRQDRIWEKSYENNILENKC